MSLSDCQASTLMRRGVISETVYWLDPSREGGSLSTSSRSLIPPPSRFATPRILNPFHDFLPVVKKEPWLTDTSRIFTTFQPCFTRRGRGRGRGGLQKERLEKNSAIKFTTLPPPTGLDFLFSPVLFLVSCDFSKVYLRSSKGEILKIQIQ